MKKKPIKSVILLLTGLTMLSAVVSCQLDYENTSAINPDNVWEDTNMITAYVSHIHGSMMPGWPFGGNANADEATNGMGNMSDYLKGVLDPTGNAAAGAFNYDKIDRINFFLDQMPKVTVMPQAEKDLLIGQMLFWRAWAYWGMVSLEGGVPLILHSQNVQDKESLFVPRNSTSECVAQILKDLDDAVAKLPATWTGANYGRIDKCAAAAFRGKVAMWWASPLFNPSKDATRWQNAYTATKAAVDICVAAGKGLRPKFGEIWDVERNEEVIMVNQFYYPDHAFDNNGIRPNNNQDMPILFLLNSFTKKDGTPFVFDPAQAGNDLYDQQYLTDLYQNLDDRFYVSIFSPGTPYPAKDDSPQMKGKSTWTTFMNNPPNYSSSMFTIETFGNGGSNLTMGFFNAKGIDKDIDIFTINQAKRDWVEIRFAEVLMNYGECANETGNTTEAIDVLKRIRARAGVGGVNNGITATTQNDIRETYIKERFAEFAFEGKRFADLRRWRRFDILNSRVARQGLRIVIKDNTSVGGDNGKGPITFDWTSSMKTPSVRQQFKLVHIPTVDANASQKYNVNTDHYFYAVSKTDIDRNAKIQQNNDWGGTFDPLK